MKKVRDVVQKYYIKAINSEKIISSGENYDKARRKMMESEETAFNIFTVVKGRDNNVIVRYNCVEYKDKEKNKKDFIDQSKEYHEQYVIDAQTLNILSDSRLLKLILNIRSMDK